MTSPREVRTLGSGDLNLIARIDRTEHVDVEYAVVDGQLIERPASIPDVRPWDPIGTGEHSVASMIVFCEPIVARGAAFFGAFDGDTLLGLAIVEAAFEPGLAWLAFLHVSREARRQGAASALWDSAIKEAAATGAESIYVSATPTGSAVGFYRSRGCTLANPPHPALVAAEPEDIHLVCPVE